VGKRSTRKVVDPDKGFMLSHAMCFIVTD